MLSMESVPAGARIARTNGGAQIAAGRAARAASRRRYAVRLSLDAFRAEAPNDALAQLAGLHGEGTAS
jgi:hypothetical protein